MNRKWLVIFAAAACAALLPLAVSAQIAPERPAKPEDPDAALKWKAYLGPSYTSLNMVNNSRYGLIGIDGGVLRDFGRFFAVTGDVAYYKWATGNGNPGNPSVVYFQAGPEVHGAIFERWNLFIHGTIGTAHVGGTQQTPDVSFAGGVGGGVEYKLARRISARFWGDTIASSFSVVGNTPGSGFSPHKTWSPRGGLNVAYRF